MSWSWGLIAGVRGNGLPRIMRNLHRTKSSRCRARHSEIEEAALFFDVLDRPEGSGRVGSGRSPMVNFHRGAALGETSRLVLHAWNLTEAEMPRVTGQVTGHVP